MSDTVEEKPLVDQAAIKVASDRLYALMARQTVAESDQETAARALEKADAQLDQHLKDVARNGSEGDARYLQAVNDATVQRDFKGRVVQQLLQLVQEEKDNLARATADAYSGLYDHGRELRLAAAQKVDGLRAEMQGAMAEFRRGSAIIMRARNAGADHAHEGVPNFIGGNLALGLTFTANVSDYSEQHERGLWGGV